MRGSTVAHVGGRGSREREPCEFLFSATEVDWHLGHEEGGAGLVDAGVEVFLHSLGEREVRLLWLCFSQCCCWVVADAGDVSRLFPVSNVLQRWNVLPADLVLGEQGFGSGDGGSTFGRGASEGVQEEVLHLLGPLGGAGGRTFGRQRHSETLWCLLDWWVVEL